MEVGWHWGRWVGLLIFQAILVINLDHYKLVVCYVAAAVVCFCSCCKSYIINYFDIAINLFYFILSIIDFNQSHSTTPVPMSDSDKIPENS